MMIRNCITVSQTIPCYSSLSSCLIRGRFQQNLFSYKSSKTPNHFILRNYSNTKPAPKKVSLWVDDEQEVKAMQTVKALENLKPLNPDEKQKADRALFEKLVHTRRKISSSEGKPIFVIFTNKQLEELVAHKPKSMAEFNKLKGVGEFKAKRYGEKFVDAINEWIREGRGLVDTPNPYKKRDLTNENSETSSENSSENSSETSQSSEIPKGPATFKVISSDSTAAKAAKRRKAMNPEALIKRLTDEGFKLSEEQRKLIDVVLSGKNVFVTGSAGTGKSFILREIVKALPANGTVVTASTGIAAVNLGGITTHSFSGVGTGNEAVEVLIERVKAKKQSVKRWRETQILVIDEISMISSSFFEKLDKVAREIRENPLEPFGGIQLILCGDFFQLPPVNEPSFAFESPHWDETVHDYVELKQIFRQSDAEFVRHLNELRVGRCDEDCKKRLEECIRPFNFDDGILPTQLFPLKALVRAKNTEHLLMLPGESKMFEAQDGGVQPFLKDLQNNCPAPAKLELKLNAQVLLVKNLDQKLGLVNGSRGVVTGFAESGYPIVKFSNCEVEIPPVVFSSQIKAKTLAWRKQIPLAHGWALSIHKSQGMTLDRSTISLRDVFQPGQAYVALSRVRSLNSLQLLDFDPRLIKVDRKVCQFYEAKFGADILRSNPLVSNGNNGNQ